MNTAKTKNVNQKNETPETINIDDVQSFEDRLVNEIVVEDPLVRFFYRNQKIITYFLVALAICFAGYRYYQSSHIEIQTRSAGVFYSLSEAYNQMLGEESKDNETLKRKFESSLMTLKEGKNPYNQLTNNYKILGLLKDKKYSEAKEAVESLKWQAASQAKKPESLLYELIVLKVAKTLYEEKTFKEYAKSTIKELAEKSNYVFVAATMAYSKIAESEDEIKLADQLIQNIKQNNPEQAKLLED